MKRSRIIAEITKGMSVSVVSVRSTLSFPVSLCGAAAVSAAAVSAPVRLTTFPLRHSFLLLRGRHWHQPRRPVSNLTCFLLVQFFLLS